MISGINIGENLGKSELTTSGTIGAAMEAATHGIPSIAVSIQVSRGDIKFHDGHVDVDFEAAQRITRKVAQKILEKGLPEGVDFVNLNIPSHLESDEILITRLGRECTMSTFKKGWILEGGHITGWMVIRWKMTVLELMSTH